MILEIKLIEFPAEPEAVGTKPVKVTVVVPTGSPSLPKSIFTAFVLKVQVSPVLEVQVLSDPS